MRPILACTVFLIGCGFPQFGFGPSDAGPAVDGSIEGGSADSGSADARVDDAHVGDAHVDDVRLADTGVAIDTGHADTAMPIDVGPETAKAGCTGSTAAFCMDFESSSLPVDGWSDEGLSALGKLAIETTGAHSPSKLLFAQTSAAATTMVSADLGKLLTAPSIGAEARIDVWIKLESAMFSGNRVFLFKYMRAGAGDGLAFSLDSTGFFLEVIAPPYKDERIVTPVPVGGWFHVRMEAKLQYVNGSVRVYIDDMATPVLNLASRATLETDSVDRRLAVGLYAQSSTTDFRARFDDVTVAWK